MWVFVLLIAFAPAADEVDSIVLPHGVPVPEVAAGQPLGLGTMLTRGSQQLSARKIDSQDAQLVLPLSHVTPQIHSWATECQLLNGVATSTASQGQDSYITLRLIV